MADILRTPAGSGPKVSYRHFESKPPLKIGEYVWNPELFVIPSSNGHKPVSDLEKVLDAAGDVELSDAARAAEEALSETYRP